MAEFLEERLPVSVRLGSSYSDEYAVDITQTRGGSEYRRLLNPYPVRRFSVNFTLAQAKLWANVINMYHRAYGMYAGFRVKCLDDYTTNAQVLPPTAFDEAMALVSTGVYQIQNYYGTGSTPISLGYPLRTIFKPVAGTVHVGVNAVEVLNSPVVNWTVDNTTGKVTFSANKTAAVSSAISKASSAVIPCAGNSFLVGETVNISGCAGMTQINGLRGQITAISAGVSITVNINSTAFSTWTSGGTLNTRPQVGEAVTSGCEFDLPCRFNSHINIIGIDPATRDCGSIEVIEILTP